MKSFLRDNPTIAFGLGLPLLLVVVFLVISGIPTLLVAPPQHDVIYATEYYPNQYGMQISVVNQKVQVVYQGSWQGAQLPRLWRYSPKTGAVREIAIVLPAGLTQSVPGTLPQEQVTKAIQIEVPDAAGLTIDSSSIAPDGYEFKTTGSEYSGDIFTGLFSRSRYGNEPSLTKSGRSIRLPNVNGQHYYGNMTRFVGWVIAP